MEVYSQTDPRWENNELGGVGTIREFGCFDTAIAQAMLIAGHEVTPAQVVDALNNNGGYDKGYTLWAKVTEAFGFFHFGDQGSMKFKLVKGSMPAANGGRSDHWVLQDSTGKVYDPWYGVNVLPRGWQDAGKSYDISVDEVSAPQPVQAPTPQPEPAPAPIVEPAPAPVIPAEVFPREIVVTATHGIHVRKEPNTQSAYVNPDSHQIGNAANVISNGRQFTAVAIVTGENVNGNDQWYRSPWGNYVWSGGCI